MASYPPGGLIPPNILMQARAAQSGRDTRKSIFSFLDRAREAYGGASPEDFVSVAKDYADWANRSLIQDNVDEAHNYWRGADTGEGKYLPMLKGLGAGAMEGLTNLGEAFTSPTALSMMALPVAREHYLATRNPMMTEALKMGIGGVGATFAGTQGAEAVQAAPGAVEKFQQGDYLGAAGDIIPPVANALAGAAGAIHGFSAPSVQGPPGLRPIIPSDVGRSPFVSRLETFRNQPHPVLDDALSMVTGSGLAGRMSSQSGAFNWSPGEGRYAYTQDPEVKKLPSEEKRRRLNAYIKEAGQPNPLGLDAAERAEELLPQHGPEFEATNKQQAKGIFVPKPDKKAVAPGTYDPEAFEKPITPRERSGFGKPYILPENRASGGNKPYSYSIGRNVQDPEHLMEWGKGSSIFNTNADVIGPRMGPAQHVRNVEALDVIRRGNKELFPSTVYAAIREFADKNGADIKRYRLLREAAKRGGDTELSQSMMENARGLYDAMMKNTSPHVQSFFEQGKVGHRWLESKAPVPPEGWTSTTGKRVVLDPADPEGLIVTELADREVNPHVLAERKRQRAIEGNKKELSGLNLGQQKPRITVMKPVPPFEPTTTPDVAPYPPPPGSSRYQKLQEERATTPKPGGKGVELKEPTGRLIGRGPHEGLPVVSLSEEGQPKVRGHVVSVDQRNRRAVVLDAEGTEHTVDLGSLRKTHGERIEVSAQEELPPAISSTESVEPVSATPKTEEAVANLKKSPYKPYEKTQIPDVEPASLPTKELITQRTRAKELTPEVTGIGRVEPLRVESDAELEGWSNPRGAGSMKDPERGALNLGAFSRKKGGPSVPEKQRAVELMKQTPQMTWMEAVAQAQHELKTTVGPLPVTPPKSQAAASYPGVTLSAHTRTPQGTISSKPIVPGAPYAPRVGTKKVQPPILQGPVIPKSQYQQKGVPPSTHPPNPYSGPPPPRLPEMTFKEMVNARRAAPIEGRVVARQFENLRNDKVRGILDYQKNPNDPKYQGIGDFFDQKRKQVLAAGEPDFGWKENYLPQLWKNTPAEIKAAMKRIAGRKAGKSPSFTKESVLENYAEGIKEGLVPKVDNVPDLIHWYEQTANVAMANRMFDNYLRRIGVIKSQGKQPGDWVRLTNYPKRLYTDAQGNTHGLDVYARPDFAKNINAYYDEGNKTLENTAKVASYTKNLIMAGGIPKTAFNWHGLSILARRGITSDNPVAAVKNMSNLFLQMADPRISDRKMAANLDKVPEYVRHGLKLGGEGNEIFKRAFDTNTPIGKLGKASEAIDNWFSRPLFEHVLPSLKVEFAEEISNKYIKSGMARPEALTRAAEQTNNFFGGINWEQEGRSQNAQNMLRTLVLAPDWTEGNMRVASGMAKALKNPNAPENKIYKSMALNLVTGWTLANLINYGINGHFMNDNKTNSLGIEFGKDSKGKVMSLMPFGGGADFLRVPLEIVDSAGEGDLGKLGRTVKGRLSPPVSTAINLITGQDDFGRPLYKRGSKQLPLGTQATNFGLEAVSPFTPNPARSLTRASVDAFSPKTLKSLNIQPTSGLESGVSAFEFPMRFRKPKKTYFSGGDF